MRCETWDDGRLTVNAAFAETLRANGLDTFDAIMHGEIGDVAKNLRRDRTTHRVSLTTPDGTAADFYVKRHRPPPLKDYIKPLLNLSRPIVGARNEWLATQYFLQAGIPTTVPVAYGHSGGESFLITEGLGDGVKLSQWFDDADESETAELVDRVAATALRMHTAGLHHQDFYLGHLLLPADRDRGLQVLDLGRARKRRRLGTRWIVKDLAQLKYSARNLPEWAVERLFARYFDSGHRSDGQHLRRRIDRKATRIARHTRKRKL